MRGFADLPSEIERRVAGGERVVCVLLDAFGLRFLERHGDHPFLRRLETCELATQFPSTTTAHVTTMHTGLPVARHGLYEWNVYEPAIGCVITPLLFSAAGDRGRDTLAASGLRMRDVLPPAPTFYERLGARSAVFQPSRFSPSTYDTVACRGAAMRPYDRFDAALREAAGGDHAYAYVYFDAIDLTGHLCGPSSPEFDDTARYALDALEAALPAYAGVTLLVTADHGQIEVDPQRTLWLDELWPGLRDRLAQRPAGSARDVFLHARPGQAEKVAEGLLAAVGDAAEVVAGPDVLSLFAGEPGPRLLERVGDVCVLPERGRMAWLRCATDLQARFRGHHGGRTPEESRTWVGVLRT